MSTLAFQGGSFSGLLPRGFRFWHICHVDCHGHFTLKQLRLSLVNEVHTNFYTGPRLIVKILFKAFCACNHKILVFHNRFAFLKKDKQDDDPDGLEVI